VIRTTFDKPHLQQKMAIPGKNRDLADQCTLSRSLRDARPPGGAEPPSRDPDGDKLEHHH
jgi:hypothetical protein